MNPVPIQKIVTPAWVAGRPACAFNVIGIEHAEAIVAGAEMAGSPVILQLSENCVAYHGALEPIGRAILAVADTADVLVAVHLDHATSEVCHVRRVQPGVRGQRPGDRCHRGVVS
jgi:fructose-bisphosphate aldolase class II